MITVTETSTQPTTESQAEVNGATVYITKYGSKYHREWCRYINNDSTEITVSEAEKMSKTLKTTIYRLKSDFCYNVTLVTHFPTRVRTRPYHVCVFPIPFIYNKNYL